MAEEPENLLGTVTNHYAKARGVFSRVSGFINWVTFRIEKAPPAELVAEVGRRWTLDEEERLRLLSLAATKTGATFIEEKVQNINRASYHRSAFFLNALTQLLFVDLAAQLYISFPALKIALIFANLALALVAHLEMRGHYQGLAAGPNALPPKRKLWGMFPNRDYNRAVKKHSRPYARAAWREKSLYRPGYFFNAATIFLGAQFILAPEKLIFPFGFVMGKITGLFTTIVMIFDVWRGVRAGDDARLAREKEISVYRDMDI